MKYAINYSRCYLFSFIVVILLVRIVDAEVKCPGTYSGHLQGITVDDDQSIYWCFTTVLVKTNSKGKLLAKVTVASHHGDLTFHQGKVYVAVNLGKFNVEAGQADSWVYVYQTKNLKLVSKHKVPEVVHGAGGIGYHKDHFYVVGGLPPGHKANYIYQYDKKFKFIKKHTINGYTSEGIQTACFANGHWWFGCYGKPKRLLKADSSFRLIGRYKFDCSIGICKGSKKTLIIGRHFAKHRFQAQAIIAIEDRKNGLTLSEHRAK